MIWTTTKKIMTKRGSETQLVDITCVHSRAVLARGYNKRTRRLDSGDQGDISSKFNEVPLLANSLTFIDSINCSWRCLVSGYKKGRKTRKSEPIWAIASQSAEIWKIGDHHWIQRVK